MCEAQIKPAEFVSPNNGGISGEFVVLALNKNHYLNLLCWLTISGVSMSIAAVSKVVLL